MKILFVSQYFHPEQFSNNNIVEYLTARGHDVMVLAATPNYPHGKAYPGYGAFRRWKETVFGARVIRAPTITRGRTSLRLMMNYVSYAVSASVLAMLELRRFHPDVVFASQPSPITIAIPAIVAGRIARKPVILWTQDLWPESVAALVDLERSMPRRMVARVIAALSKAIYRHVDVLFSPSRLFAPRLHDRAPGVPVVYWPNTTDPAVIPPAPDPERRRTLGIGKDRICLAYAGNIGEAQDPAIIARAAALLPDLPVTFLVMGDGRAKPELLAEIERLGVSDRFVFTGHLPVSEVAANLAIADAALLTLRDVPAFSLTVPYRLQGFLAAGKPVLSCGGEAAGAIIAEAQCGFSSKPGDANGFADAIRRFCALSPAERAGLGERAARYCSLNFARERVFGNLETILVHVVSRHDIPPEFLV